MLRGRHARSDADRMPVHMQTGWKRALVRLPEVGPPHVAGVFAREFGGFDACQGCSCGRAVCWCGFSAHATLAGAMRYRPLTAVIAQVQLGETIRVGGGRTWRYLVARHQVVEALLWPRLCNESTCQEAAVGLAVGPESELAPACALHGVSITLERASERAGAPMGWLSDSYAHWARLRSVPPPRTRCPCARLTLVAVDQGLALYLSDLWEWGTQTRPGVWGMRCRLCGVSWEYMREAGQGRKLG